jgi:hypothetical protein
MRNENASAGGLAGFFLLIMITVILVALLAPIVDEMNHANNGMTVGSGIPVSQERLDTMFLLSLGFGAIAFFVLLAAGYNYIANTITERNQEV